MIGKEELGQRSLYSHVISKCWGLGYHSIQRHSGGKFQHLSLLRRTCRVKLSLAEISLQLLISKALLLKICPCPNPQIYEHVIFDGERDFSAVIQALEMRLLCITWVGPLLSLGSLSRQEGQSQRGVAGAALLVWNGHRGYGKPLEAEKGQRTLCPSSRGSHSC